MRGAGLDLESFARTPEGSHFMMILLEPVLKHAVQQVMPMDQASYYQEFGCDPQVELDLELLLNHLSKVRVAAEFNAHAEMCLEQFERCCEEIHLIDARGYVMDALRIAPKQHPEAGRANKNLGLLLMARKRNSHAKVFLNKAFEIYRKMGKADLEQEILEIIEKQTSSL